MQTYVVTLRRRLGNHLFADMIFDSETVAGKKIESPVGAIPMHAIVRIEVTANQFVLRNAGQRCSGESRNPQEATPLKLLSAQRGAHHYRPKPMSCAPTLPGTPWIASPTSIT